MDLPNNDFNAQMTTMASLEMQKAIVNSPNVVCECGSKVFAPGVVLKKVSALTSPTGKEEIIDIPVYVCAKCGEVPRVYKDKPNYNKIFGEENNNQK